MTSSYVIAVECEGFLPLDPRDPENLDRKAADRDRAHNPAAADARDRERAAEQKRRRAEWQDKAKEQRSELLKRVENVDRHRDDVKLVDHLIRDDGTAILYFEFDPAVEGDHFVRHELVELDANEDPNRGPLLTARRAVTTVPNKETRGEGAVTWDSALRNEVEHARSSVVGAGLQVVGVRVDVLEKGKKSGAKTSRGKEAKVSDQGPTHQESQRQSDEPNLSDQDVKEQRSEELQEQKEARRKEAERRADQSKGKRSKS